MKNKLSLFLISFGILCLAGAAILFIKDLSAEEQGNWEKWILILLAAGSSIKGWFDLFKKDEPSGSQQATTTISASNGGQIAIGESARNIQQGGNAKYVETEIHYHHESPPKPHEPHSTIGQVPPASTTSYVHRGKIEEEVRAALSKGEASAIVGLHAPGGSGKTELANCIAQEAKNKEHGFQSTLWLDVNDKSAPEVLNEALVKCGIKTEPNATEAEKNAEWHSYLEGRKLLVVFDDVREKALHGLRDILPQAPNAALITSRIQQIPGVREFPLDRMEPEQALQVFVNSLGEEAVNAEKHVAEKLAERCKYNPLALEIASRRIRQNQKQFQNPIAKYYERAEKRFEELKMHGDERWNLTAVFDLSYNDLNESDQACFRALSVFAPTGFSPNAAAYMWNMNEGEAGDVLMRFTNLSLVIPVKGDFERYRLHDLLDEYATLKSGEAGERESTTTQLAEWLIGLFGKHSTDNLGNAPEVGLEFDNLAKAARWAIANKKGELLAALATKPHNWLRNYFRQHDEWRNWLESSLEMGIADKQLKANALQVIGDVQQFRNDRDAALGSYTEALKLFKEIGDKLGEANALKAIGDVQRFRKELDAALGSYGEALKLSREIGDKLGEANVLQAIGDVQQFRKELDAALASYGEALKLYREIGAKLGEANVLKAIGDVQQFRKELDAALASYTESLKLYWEIGDKLGEANVLKAIGDVQRRDDRDGALASYTEALKLYRETGAKLGEADVLASMGRLALQSGDVAVAETQLEKVILMRREIGDLYGEGADYANFAIALFNLGHKGKARECASKARLVFERINLPALVEMTDQVIAAADG